MTVEEWDAARARVRDFLLLCAAERRTTTYSAVSGAAAPAFLPPYSYGMVAMLEEVCAPDFAERGVVLASLVCTKATGMPGEGYFRSAEREGWNPGDRRSFWESEVERVFAYFAGA
jgi:hypothetical protein